MTVVGDSKIIEGDSLQILKQIEDESIDLIVTDPPYGYSFMGKEWDKVVVSVDTWKECLRVLKAGAFAFVMSAPRQDVLSRMIVNLQDAGFRTDFTSIYWTYASGFPKAANVSKLVDKRLGEKREIIGKSGNGVGKISNSEIYMINHPNSKMKKEIDITVPKSEQAKKLDGSYAGFQPKPAVEVVLVVMKPLSEKSFVDQALNNGKGVTWLDSVRIPFQNENDKDKTIFRSSTGFNSNSEIYHNSEKYELTDVMRTEKGRFPANLLVSDDALNDGKEWKGGSNKSQAMSIYGNNMKERKQVKRTSDSGSYSRYFDLDSWYSSQFIITPKASPSERNGSTHPTMKPIKLMSYLITMGSREKDVILDPFCGSGTTCIAATILNRKFTGIELKREYVEIANKRLEPYLHQSKLITYKKTLDDFLK